MDDYSTNNNDDLFFSLIVGLFLLEIAVGAIQVLGALIRTIICLNNKQPTGKLKIYWIMLGIYFLVFAGLWFSESFILNNMSIDFISDDTNYMERLKWYMCFLYARIAWIVLAWGIAIWYCINIVFVKRKLINSSTL
jgi:uncharacterized membrane protein